MDQFESTNSDEKNVCTESYPTAWFAPTPLTYNTPFITPFPSFNHYEMMGYANDGTAQWPTPPTYNDLTILPPHHANSSIERPRSSPSTFGPSTNDIAWPENPLGIRFPVAEAPMIASAAALPPSSYQTPATEFLTPSPPQRHCSADTQRHYPIIAPNPASLASKRRQEEHDEAATLQRSDSKRRKRTPSLERLSDEERLLITLKEDEALPWKEIAARFSHQLGQSVSVATLQMRYLRLRQRFRSWEERDIEALKQAYEYWEKCKWDIISTKMIEFGVEEKWPARFCSKKWLDIASSSSSQLQQFPKTPQQQQQQQQCTPLSQQHAPSPHYATMNDSFTNYGYAISL